MRAMPHFAFRRPFSMPGLARIIDSCNADACNGQSLRCLIPQQRDISRAPRVAMTAFLTY